MPKFIFVFDDAPTITTPRIEWISGLVPITAVGKYRGPVVAPQYPLPGVPLSKQRFFASASGSGRCVIPTTMSVKSENGGYTWTAKRGEVRWVGLMEETYVGTETGFSPTFGGWPDPSTLNPELQLVDTRLNPHINYAGQSGTGAAPDLAMQLDSSLAGVFVAKSFWSASNAASGRQDQLYGPPPQQPLDDTRVLTLSGEKTYADLALAAPGLLAAKIAADGITPSEQEFHASGWTSPIAPGNNALRAVNGFSSNPGYYDPGSAILDQDPAVGVARWRIKTGAAQTVTATLVCKSNAPTIDTQQRFIVPVRDDASYPTIETRELQLDCSIAQADGSFACEWQTTVGDTPGASWYLLSVA